MSTQHYSTKVKNTLDFVENHIFGIYTHHTSLLGTWFSWTLSKPQVLSSNLTLNLVKRCHAPQKHIYAETDKREMEKTNNLKQNLRSTLCSFCSNLLIRGQSPIPHMRCL